MKMTPNKDSPLTMLLGHYGMKCEIENEFRLWHLRYDHLNYLALNY